MLTYCFESAYVPRTLAKFRKNDLAVVDTEGHEKAVREAVSRGVYVYGYLNVGAIENGRSYYERFHHIRLAKYSGWDGEYWINPTAKEWQEHVISEAKKIKATGAIGLYLDNTDIYYMCLQGFREEKTKMLRSAPSAQAVYNALSSIILKISALGLIVMPNGGNTFLRKFMVAHPRIIQTINQEGVFYQELNEKNSATDTKYYKDWCKWAQKRISGKVRIICYVTIKSEQAKIKAYCLAHGWDVYFSKHKELRGD
jgi:Predicted extracellular endo alpha-1,4 polygalactosaminidase or related polysaccharide hydrolase